MPLGREPTGAFKCLQDQHCMNREYAVDQKQAQEQVTHCARPTAWNK